jgi:DNA-binding NarL/FixJ family response regulator
MNGTRSGETAAEWPISVFLLDDHEVFRRGLRDLLAAEPDIDVVGEAGTVAAALRRLAVLRPDVAVLDVRLPDGNGISVCREIGTMQRGTACLMLTAFGDDQALLSAILAGAGGYVLKQACGSDLIQAVRRVAAGHSMLDPDQTHQVMARVRARPDQTHQVMARVRARIASGDQLTALTGQEKEILDLIAEGLTNREIAESMALTGATAKNCVSSLLSKLGMQRRTQAAAFAGGLGLDRRQASHEDF